MQFWNAIEDATFLKCCQNPISALKDGWKDEEVAQSIVQQKFQILPGHSSDCLSDTFFIKSCNQTQLSYCSSIPISSHQLPSAPITPSPPRLQTYSLHPSLPYPRSLTLSGLTAQFEWHVISEAVACVLFHLKSSLQAFKERTSPSHQTHEDRHTDTHLCKSAGFQPSNGGAQTGCLTPSKVLEK